MTNLPVDNSSQEGLVSGNPGQEVDDDGGKFVQQQVTEELNPAMQRIKAGDQSKEEHAGRLTHHLNLTRKTGCGGKPHYISNESSLGQSMRGNIWSTRGYSTLVQAEHAQKTKQKCCLKSRTK